MLKERLKQIRLTIGYNLQKMANVLNVPKDTYIGYEYRTKNIPDTFLCALVNSLNVNLNWLYTGRGDMFISNCENTLIKTDNKAVSSNISTFYKRLNELQAKNEMNDYEFSKLLDITEGRIEKLGIGKSLPELEELNKIKANFDISIDWLLYGETPQKRSQDDGPTLTSEEINILKKLASKQII